MEVDEPIGLSDRPSGESGAVAANPPAPSTKSTSSLAAVQEEPTSTLSSGTVTPREVRSSVDSMLADPTSQETEAAHALVAAQTANVGSSTPQSQSVPLPANYDPDQPICANCHTQNTPLWRRSHDSTQILCNACALFYKMKGRPRPISLKTDVIKSRNRSKGKSASRDRQSGKKDRAPSSSRLAGDNDDSDSDDAESESRKPRKMSTPFGMPPYPYPYPYPYPHPHQHQPYPMPSTSRSRSSSNTRRGQSVEGRSPWQTLRPGKADGPPAAYPYPYPPPPGPMPGQPGAEYAYPYYYMPPGPGFPGQPGFAPPPGYPIPGHLNSSAFSDSRSQTGESPRSSASPPHTTRIPQSHYPHPNPNYPHSSLAASKENTTHSAPELKDLASSAKSTNQRQSSSGPTLAPLQSNSPAGAPKPLSSDSTEKASVSLPPIGSLASSTPAAPNVPSIPRHTALFQQRGKSEPSSAAAADSSANEPGPAQDRTSREQSISSNSGASVSGASSEGVLSPPPSSHAPLSWGAAAPWAAAGIPEGDERRGRPERRHEGTNGDSHHQGGQPAHANGMVGVEGYLNDLRVRDPSAHPTLDGSGSSRSRSSGHEERGRSRGRFGGRSSSQYRAGVSPSVNAPSIPATLASPSQDRSTSSSSSRATGGTSGANASGGSFASKEAAEAEVARLKTKVAELTFLNSLMQSRLMQLEGPDRVPVQPVSTLNGGSAASGQDEDSHMDEAAQQDDDFEAELAELSSYGVSATKDAATRKQLLAFFRAQKAGQSTTSS